MSLSKITFNTCLLASLVMLVAGFIVPPTGVIDGSVLTAVGELFAFATLAQLPTLIHGRKVDIEHGNTAIHLGDNDDHPVQQPLIQNDMARNVKYIVVHCTAGNQKQTVNDLLHYWRTVKKWKYPGYHYVVTADGTCHQLLDESKSSNGVAGYNSKCINIAYTGGVDVAHNLEPIDNRTEAQKSTLASMLRHLRKKYPDARILGHRDMPNVKKACPSFDAIMEYNDI